MLDRFKRPLDDSKDKYAFANITPEMLTTEDVKLELMNLGEEEAQHTGISVTLTPSPLSTRVETYSCKIEECQGLEAANPQILPIEDMASFTHFEPAPCDDIERKENNNITI